MQRSITLLAVVLLCGGALATVGCSDELKTKDAHIALIEDTNQRLTEDLAAAQRRTDDLMRQGDECNAQLVAARSGMDDLKAQLAAVPQPTTPEGWQSVPGGAMIAIEGSVLFSSGKAALRDRGRSTLAAITSTIRAEYPTKDIYVMGHTDDVPIKKSGWKDNYELSAQRALSVVRYLADHGIDPRRLVACGAGQHRPRVPNANDDNRTRNRRVEIYAVDPIN